MTSELDIKLLPWQQEVWNDPVRFKIVAAGRRTGKSRLAAWLLICLLYTSPSPRDS